MISGTYGNFMNVVANMAKTHKQQPHKPETTKPNPLIKVASDFKPNR